MIINLGFDRGNVAQQGKCAGQKSEGVSRKRRETRKWGLTKKSAKKKWQDKEKSSTKNGSTNRDQSPWIVEEGPKKHAQSKRA